jgi:coenzyme PQQ precursor peptide PqqA
MKIMRGECRVRLWAPGALRAMLCCGIFLPAPAATAALHRRLLMQWQTPQANDFRFGFEITMYVAKR